MIQESITIGRLVILEMEYQLKTKRAGKLIAEKR